MQFLFAHITAHADVILHDRLTPTDTLWLAGQVCSLGGVLRINSYPYQPLEIGLLSRCCGGEVDLVRLEDVVID